MKKKFTLCLGIVLSILITSQTLKAQCTFISPTVDINSINTDVNGNCVVNVNLSFDVITNSGNKIIFLHLWEQSDYPSLNYSTNQSQPNATDLAATVANFVIDNNNAVPVFLTSYGPANTVAVKTPANNPGLTISRVSSTTVGADRILINNLILTVPGACTNSFSFQGDAWSSNANNNNPVVHCSMAGFIVGGTDPAVTISRTCTSYTLDVSTVSASKNVYYDIRIDDGDGIFETTDPLIGNVPSSSAITVTPSSPYNSGTVLLAAPYNSAPYTSRVIFAAVSSQGDAFIGLSTSNTSSCGLAPIILSDFYAQRKTSSSVLLTWKTATELNAKGFDIERKTDNGFIKVGFVAATNNASGAKYSYQDNSNTSKAISQYRIKMVDKDETYKLSETRNVRGNLTASDFTVFPNPSSGSSKISISDIAEPTDVQLIDNAGKVIKTFTITNTNSVQLTNLQPGIYLVRLITKSTGESITKKLSVVK